VRPDSFVLAGVAGTGTSYASTAFWLNSTVKISGQAVVSSGTMNGTFTFQFSNDIPVGAPPNTFQPTNWSAVGSTGQLANCSATSTTKNFMLTQFETSYGFGRIVFTDLSGGAALGLWNFQLKTIAL